MNKRIAILTGGGDVPGLNVCLKSLVNRLIDLGMQPLGVRKGWEGLINYDIDDPTSYQQNFIELTRNRVRAIDQTSGSFLHSSRLDPRQTPHDLQPTHLKSASGQPVDLTEHVLKSLAYLDLYGLVVLGDDDMLNFAALLAGRGVPVIAIPKTIHNNINGTDYTLGFSTGLARGVHFVHELRALAGSREQVVVVETFGERSGYSALLIAYLAGVDRSLIPEVPYDPEMLAYLVRQDKRASLSNYAVVSVTNGSSIVPEKIAAAESYLSAASFAAVQADQRGRQAVEGPLTSSGLITAELLQNLLGEELFFQQLTYLMRTGAPDGQDLLGAANFGLMAARLLEDGEFGRMTAFQRQHAWTHVDLATAVQTSKQIDPGPWYDAQTYRPTDGLIWSATVA